MSDPRPCEWVTLKHALSNFVRNESGHQGQAHIKPLHHYVACRLVLEGGFHPDEVTPRPPFRVVEKAGRKLLQFEATAAGSGEQTVLGGLKTKNIDVVVTKPQIGPVVATSMKGTLGAFRNLTNRMEEAVGDCTNLHISYPALVYGFIQVIRGTRASREIATNDACLTEKNEIVDSVLRYHDVIARLDGRADLRDVTTKYEAIALMIARTDPPHIGEVLEGFPGPASPLAFSSFFERIYTAYDLRFVFAAPLLKATTTRIIWDPASPAFGDPRSHDYPVRLG